MAKFERLINHAKFKATRMMAMSKAWTVADTNFDSKVSLTRLKYIRLLLQRAIRRAASLS